MSDPEAHMAQLSFDPSTLSRGDLALYESMVERRRAQGAGFGGPYAALMNHPRLCAKIEDLGYYLKFEGRLPRDIYQFAVLCVAKHTGAAFEWIDHVRHAEAAGVPEAAICSLRQSGISGGHFPEPYDLVARLLSVTLSWGNVPQALQDACIRKFAVEGFIELVVVSGFYQMFSAINQGFDVSAPGGGSTPRE
jgi:4-carboxymuconolactone decarboxylase